MALMLDAEAVMPLPKGNAVGRDAVIAAFRENPSFKEGIVSWAPVAAAFPPTARRASPMAS